MRLPLSMLVLILAPSLTEAQATSVEEPPPPFYVEEFTKLLGIQDAIGDLRNLVLSDSALELRFWSIGWSLSGLQLRRSANGVWTAQRIVVEGLRVARVESLPQMPAATLDSMWDQLVSEGMLTLPTHVPRTWGMVDGHSYFLELRRGQSYRAVHIEHVNKPEVPADTAIKRIASLLKQRFPFIGMPIR